MLLPLRRRVSSLFTALPTTSTSFVANKSAWPTAINCLSRIVVLDNGLAAYQRVTAGVTRSKAGKRYWHPCLHLLRCSRQPQAYSFDPYANITDSQRHLVLGGQHLLWTEQSSPNNIDPIVWPRAAASAEVFWSGPGGNGQAALARLHDLAYRITQRGIERDTLAAKVVRIATGQVRHRFLSRVVIGGILMGPIAHKGIPHSRAQTRLNYSYIRFGYFSVIFETKRLRASSRGPKQSLVEYLPSPHSRGPRRARRGVGTYGMESRVVGIISSRAIPFFRSAIMTERLGDLPALARSGHSGHCTRCLTGLPSSLTTFDSSK
jgi:hypothetical protein